MALPSADRLEWHRELRTGASLRSAPFLTAAWLGHLNHRTPKSKLETYLPDPTQPRCVLISHSYLSASRGSTLVARRAGIRQATSAISIRTRATMPKVAASVGFTSNKRVAIVLVSQ